MKAYSSNYSTEMDIFLHQQHNGRFCKIKLQGRLVRHVDYLQVKKNQIQVIFSEISLIS